MPFLENPRELIPQGLPFKLKGYIELVDWIGRMIREDKRGNIEARLPPILDRLDIVVIGTINRLLNSFHSLLTL